MGLEMGWWLSADFTRRTLWDRPPQFLQRQVELGFVVSAAPWMAHDAASVHGREGPRARRVAHAMRRRLPCCQGP